jgi:poly-gamma-glutamate synthase PgsB/CapB
MTMTLAFSPPSPRKLKRRTRSSEKRIRRLLTAGLALYEQKLYTRELDDLASRVATQTRSALELVEGLQRAVEEELWSFDNLRQDLEAFEHAIPRNEDERRHKILDFSVRLGSSAKELRSDRRALGRWLDEDAIRDRFEHKIGATQQRLTVVLRCLPSVVKAALGRGGKSDQAAAWEQLQLATTFLSVVTQAVDRRVAATALRALAQSCSIQSCSIPAAGVVLTAAAWQLAERLALDAEEDVDVQCAALDVLAHSSTRLPAVLVERLGTPKGGDDLFVRRHAVKVLGEQLAQAGVETRNLMTVVAVDPSPFVRQGVAEVLAMAPVSVAKAILPWLACRDKSPQVRAQALLVLPALNEHPEMREKALKILDRALEVDDDVFVRRVALRVAAEAWPRLAAVDAEAAQAWRQTLAARIAELRRTAEPIALRRHAAQAGERLWLASDPVARGLAETFRSYMVDLRCGKSRRLPRGRLEVYDDDLVGRVMAVLALDGFGLDLEGNDRLTRGPRMRFRFWRLLHEWRHPAPDKRQAFRHWLGRVSYGRLRAPSPLLGELAPTQVPGEPLYLEEEEGWRPYLPLVDDVLSSLNQLGRVEPVRFYTSEGITEVMPPRSGLRRLLAYGRLQWRFAELAQLRNWRQGTGKDPLRYLTALRELGFEICFYPHPAGTSGKEETPEDVASEADPSVLRFFSQMAAVPAMQDLEEYLRSPYANDVDHLVWILGFVVALFAGRQLWYAARQRWARGGIPLVIGGWGTRGKSGTERLKAALLNGLGASLVCKTTGCEALFLEAPAFGRLREISLYRPYDKATIWEQHRLTLLARRLGAGTLLWECMGLTPAYVEILQRSWMRDDVSTLTNTYPDHEDLQGPAGHDVAQTMCSFLPAGGRVVTTEEQMLPIVAEGASTLGASLRSAGWLETGLLTPDVLERFPYVEHPANVALVLALSDELGIDPGTALRQMADRVVPDVGVLRTYPRLELEGRTLEFTNGMSANERHAALGNWQRMGFGRHDPEAEPEVRITALVNNRADRLPRSQVFAEILARDIAVDHYVLIGSDLDGFVGRIRQSWRQHVEELTLWRSDKGPNEVLREAARWMRQPVSGEEYVLFEQRLLAITIGEEPVLDVQYRSLLTSWFERKLVVVEGGSGKGALEVLRDLTPPGCLNRILGMQNIKGAGLAFLSRWESLVEGDSVEAEEKTTRRVGFLGQLVAPLVEVRDSVRRRRRADRVYRELAAQQISRQRAAVELQQLVRA